MGRTKAARKAKHSPYPSSPPHNTGPPSHAKGKGTYSSSSSPSSSPPRRPIRPVDRQKMLDWLLEKLNSNEMSKSLRWEEEGKVFLVRWPHAARHGFSKDDDAQLYKAYAQHTGLYQEGDLGDHKRWKANFRCALHSLPNVKEISTKDGRKGPNAARRFEILDKAEAKKRKTSKRQSCPERSPQPKGDDSDSGVSLISEVQDPLPSTVSTLLQTPADDDADTSSNVPNFQHLGLTPFIKLNHLSGGCVKELPPITSPSPITAVPSNFFTLTNLPSTTTTTTTTVLPVPPFSCSSSLLTPSYPTPTAARTNAAISNFSEDLGEDMKPVGIMVISSRDRTPSGDSGLPGSPPLGGHEVVFGEEFLELDNVDDIQEVEEVMLTDIGANVSIDESEMESSNSEQCGTSDDIVRQILDISHSRPDSAVAVQIATHDELMYVDLQL